MAILKSVLSHSSATSQSTTHLVPVPEPLVGDAQGALVLLQGRLHQDDVELAPQLAQLERQQVRLQVHRRRGRLLDQLVLAPRGGGGGEVTGLLLLRDRVRGGDNQIWQC